MTQDPEMEMAFPQNRLCNNPIIFKTAGFWTGFPHRRAAHKSTLFSNGFGEPPICHRISFRRNLSHKRIVRLRVQSVAGSNPGGLFSDINGAWENAFQEPNLDQSIIEPPPDPPTDGSFGQVLSYIWNLAAGDPNLGWRLSVSLVLLFGSKVAGLGGPILLKWAMDELTKGSTNLQSEHYIYVVIVVLIFSALTKAISSGLNEVRYVVFAPLGHAAGRRIGVYLLQHMLHLDLSFHLEQSSGVLLRILERAQRSVVHVFRAVVFTFFPTTMELILVCALLAQQVGTMVAGIVLVSFIAYVVWTINITRAATSSRIKANKFEERVSGKAVDALLNYETVVQFNNQSLEVLQYNQLLLNYQHAMLDAEYLSATLNGGQAAILSVGVAAVMALTGLHVAKGSMGIGNLVLANGLILQVAGPLQFLGFLYRDLRQSLVDLDSLFKILSTKSSLEDGCMEFQSFGRGVSLRAENIHFSYKSSRKVLFGVSFSVDPGESIAIVGPSGSGKSTIVKLLLRLYDPDHGTLFIGGHDICSLTKASIRRAVAVVPQDTILFNDTIYYNILYGLPTASETDVIRAAKQARLHEAVLKMPKGYMTVVGERGLKLSGGEKQRVAIARAFLKEPKLLICDEATSALDSSTEASILKSLKELATGRTCVFVAHRLSTIMHCDKIMVLEAGWVVEQGTHQRLLAQQALHITKYQSMECGQITQCSNDTLVSNQCVLLEKDGSVRIEENVLSTADMEMGSILLSTIFGEVCGTDVHLRHGRLNTVVYPIIPGHVAVGRVHTICGSVADVDGVQIEKGDVVTFLDVIDTCYSCIQCLVHKQSTRCPKRRVIGICKADHMSIRGLLGGWSKYLYLPPNTKIIRLPNSLPPQVFIAGGCGLPTALHAVDRADVHLMDRVVIQGSGPVGLMAALLARASGSYQVLVIGAPAHRLEVFRKFGFEDTISLVDFPDPLERKRISIEMMGGKLADVVIEATGRPEAVSEGMQLCRDGGTYVIVGQYTDNGSVSINPHFLINHKHITIKGSWGSDFSHFYRGVQFMDKNSHLPWDLVTSKCFDLKDAEEAIACVERLEVFKALLRPTGTE